MSGQRYIDKKESDPIKESKIREESSKKKDLFVDTLIIVTGFVIAGSNNLTSTLYFTAIYLFLLLAIVVKIINNLPQDTEKISIFDHVMYFFLSLFFPLIFISFFSTKDIFPYPIIAIGTMAFVSFLLFFYFVMDPVDKNIELDSWYNIGLLTALVTLLMGILLILNNPYLAKLSLTITSITFVFLSLLLYFFDKYKEKIRNKKESISMILIIALFILLFLWWDYFFFKLIEGASSPSNLITIENATFMLNNKTYNVQNLSLHIQK